MKKRSRQRRLITSHHPTPQPQFESSTGAVQRLAPTSNVTPQNALSLQRMVGNRAVTQMIERKQRASHPAQNQPIIQRVFESGATFLGNTDARDAMLTAMGGFMDEYNTFLAKDPKEAADFGDAARTLRLLDRKIFEYFNHHNATTHKIEDTPHYVHVEALRKQAAKEHEEFVSLTQTTPGMLPFDFDNMERGAAMKLITLWNKIRNGMGKIRVSGDDAYKKRVYSWLVKLLETPTGRDILGYLNAGDPSELMTNIYLGQDKSELPDGVEEQAKAKGRDLEDQDRSEAQPLGDTGEMTGPVPITGAEDPDKFPTIVNANGFKNAILAGKKGIILNGKKYTFNVDPTKLVGAFVTAFEGASKSEGASHNQILTPGWITLGHELGHAVHFRGGGTNMVSAGIMQDMTGKSREELEQVWQNSEELLTIQGWENSLRGDVGISERSSHIPYTAGKRVERYWSIYGDFKATYQDPSFVGMFADLKTLKTDLGAALKSKTAATSFDDDAHYASLQQRWVVLKTKYTAEDLKQKKREVLLPKYQEMVTNYTTKKRAYDAKWFVGKAKKTEWRKLAQTYLELKDKVDNHFDEVAALETDVEEGHTSAFKKFFDQVDLHGYALHKFGL